MQTMSDSHSNTGNAGGSGSSGIMEMKHKGSINHHITGTDSTTTSTSDSKMADKVPRTATSDAATAAHTTIPATSPTNDTKRNETKAKSEAEVDSSGVDSKKLNALEDWSNLRTKLAGRQLAVFLDYDGTLTPIVSNPGDAKISPEMTEVVDRLSKKHATAIVTGRAINTIVDFLPLPNVYYAGSHGFDIRAPGQHTQVKQVASAYLPALEGFCKLISSRVANIPGSLVENNKYSISIHYRNVANDEQVRLIERQLDELLEQYKDQLKKTHGKMVFEVRPLFDWHKGKAVNWLLTKAFQSEESKVVPIYLGDDVTDEDAFRELNKLDFAVGIHVRAPTQARATAASYTLSSIDEVQQFLTQLCDI